MYRNRNKIRVPVVPDLRSLALPDLKKILRYIQRYEADLAGYDSLVESIKEKNSAIKNQNEDIKAKYKENYDKNCLPIEHEISNTWNAIHQNHAAFLTRLLSNDVLLFRGYRLRKKVCEPLVQKLIDLEESLKKATPKGSDFVQKKYISLPKTPIEEINLKISGATFKIPLSKISSTEVSTVIDQKLSEDHTKRQKLSDLKARAASTEKEVRAQAQGFRRSFQKQLDVISCCPYCGEKFNENCIPHLDHIYPVSKGGKSSSSNLVFVCQECNLNKKALTLRSFIMKFDRNESEIYNRLELLKKDF